MGSSIVVIGLCVIMCAVIIVCSCIVYETGKEKRKMLETIRLEKTEFLSSISYDIRTPMNAIIGTTALGMEELDNPEKMKECLEKINSSSKFLLGLLNDLIDVSDIANGKFSLHPKPYAFGEFIDALKTMICPLCEEKNITFLISDAERNINLMVDPMRFYQLFFNLLTNAVKFTPEGGTVQLRLCNYATHNNIFSADYVVSDTGIGMSDEFQKILFQPFTREVSMQTQRKNGVGLGLTIVRNIVELMNGTISIKSELKKGTEIKIHLDIDVAYMQPEEKIKWNNDSETTKILQDKHIMLVEDHPLNVEITKRILEKKHAKVTCVENGKRAVEIFQNNPEHYFDAILMDIFMPELDGLQATKSIRHVPHSDAQMIPIIAMTANTSEEDIQICKNAGMNAHIGKPVEPQVLYETLCDYLSEVL